MAELTFPEDQTPGRYRVGYLEKAKREGKKLLSAIQYAYAVRQAARLRDWDDKEEMSLLRIEPVESFYELKLKGNVLGRTNIRVFFAVFGDPIYRAVVLGVYQKDEEGDLPSHIVISMRNRKREVEGTVASLARKGNGR